MPTEQIITLHLDAPDKPALGEPCNGCGICCLQNTCPLGRLRFLRAAGPCPALQWQAENHSYRCGLLATPTGFFPALPKVFQAAVPRLISRWIAAGHGCDCTTVVLTDEDAKT